MGSSIAFYCADSDLQSLQKFAQSIGLHLQAPLIGQKVSECPKDGPFCFLSLAPETELHPYGSPPLRISAARDPVLRFVRPYFSYPYLVLGHVYWSNDVPAIAERTKAIYQRLARWVRKEWAKQGDIYVGPEALALLQQGAVLVSALPGQAELRSIRT
jgi:hypothetical protein